MHKTSEILTHTAPTVSTMILMEEALASVLLLAASSPYHLGKLLHSWTEVVGHNVDGIVATEDDLAA